MKKLLISLFGCLFLMQLSTNSFGQYIQAASTSTYPGNIYHTGGNIGIGITAPIKKLQINESSANVASVIRLSGSTNYQSTIRQHWDLANNTYNGTSIFEFRYGSSGETPTMTAKAKLNSSGQFIAAGLYDIDNSNYFIKPANPTISMLLNGKVGIGTTTPVDKFQVNDLAYRVTIGSAAGQALGWGFGYIGFNAARQGTNWSIVSDNANNGSAVIYSDNLGSLNFSAIPNTGNVAYTKTDAQVKDLVAMRILSSGKVWAKEIEVKANLWADEVFKDNYKLMSLEEVEKFIGQNKHLPEVPAEKEVVENGINLGQMDALLLKKIEELTLYVIELKKENEKLLNRIEQMEE